VSSVSAESVILYTRLEPQNAAAALAMSTTCFQVQQMGSAALQSPSARNYIIYPKAHGTTEAEGLG
jgi:hypothetical protein